jgi:hypothetical protein
LNPAGAGGGIPAGFASEAAMEHMAARRAISEPETKSSLDAVLAFTSSIRNGTDIDQ